MKVSSSLTLALLAQSAAAAPAVTPAPAPNSTYYNPVLPGWHSDPSCIQVDGTFFVGHTRALSTVFGFGNLFVAPDTPDQDMSS